MNGTACKVPLATEYIHKAIANGQSEKNVKQPGVEGKNIDHIKQWKIRLGPESYLPLIKT